MARIVGGIGTTHVPSIGSAIAKGLQRDPYWKPFFDGFGGAHKWLARARPDVVVVLYNDHGLNFFLDKLPTFAVGAANEYRHADEGWGLPVSRPYPGDAALSWHLIESLVGDEFDVTMCQEMLVDHAFTIPLALLWPEPDTRPEPSSAARPVRTVPIAINTVQHPLPSPARCFRLGRAIGRAIESYPADLNVLVLGTGGLSHQLDGKRAGFINKEFDLMCMDKLVGDPEALARYSSLQIVEEAGSQGVELLNWIAMRGALTGDVGKVHGNYHVPISNTASALLVLENRAHALETTYRKAS
jgi:protocatechuate 4,5-dioxygenase beta chain